MKILVTGGSGFVGTELTRFFLEAGNKVTVLSRSGKRGAGLSDEVDIVAGDPTRPGEWQDAVAEQDVLVNLAGASIFKRWNESYKKVLRDSRILTTRNLVKAIPDAGGSVKTLVSASAVGYYGFTGDAELPEDAPPGEDFLAKLAVDWEAEAVRAHDKGVRVVVTRFGVVLGKSGGALPQMALPFRFFVGGPLGSGNQWLSWIHVEDLCRAVLFMVHSDNLEGPVNLTAPTPVTNRSLTRAIGRTLHRPSFMPAPAFAVRLVLGEFGSVILNGQRVVPCALQNSGFDFNFPTVGAALANLLGS